MVLYLDVNIDNTLHLSRYKYQDIDIYCNLDISTEASTNADVGADMEAVNINVTVNDSILANKRIITNKETVGNLNVDTDTSIGKDKYLPYSMGQLEMRCLF